MFGIIFVLLTVGSSYAVIYNLNDTEYDRLPPVFKLERFDSCLRQPGDLYCQLEAELVSDQPSDLLDIIQGYSARTLTHYNHSLIHWGVCVTKTCKEHLNRTAELHRALEGCLNESLHRDYRLQARVVKHMISCTGFDEPVVLSTGHYVFATVIFTILMLNVVGSLCEYWLGDGKYGTKLFLFFSVTRNWKRLMTPAGEGPEPRLRRLVGLNAIKLFASFGVMFFHSFFFFIISNENPDYYERMFSKPMYQLLANLTLGVQLFFLLSGFLLAYNILIAEEKKKNTLMNLPVGILSRWLRLLPPYALVLAFQATWWKDMGSGPNWKSLIALESSHCRQYWYENLFFMQNYADYHICMIATWSLAADMQLTILGLAIFTLASSPRARIKALGVAFALGLLAPAVQLYLQDLDAVLIMHPERCRKLFVGDTNFNNLYRRSHTNILNYVLGLILAMLVYYTQKNNYDVQKLKKYNILYWFSLPLIFLSMMTGAVFYTEAWEAPLVFKLLYVSGIKLVVGILMAYIILGVIFKLEGIYRAVLEWSGWTVLSRVSYCAYLIHMIFLETILATNRTPMYGSFFNLMNLSILVSATSFTLAFIMFVLVESPFHQLVKHLTPRPSEEKTSSACDVSSYKKDK